MHQPPKKDISELEKSKLEVLLKDFELINVKIEKFVGNQFLYTQGALALAGGYIFFLVEGLAVIDKALNTGIETEFYLQFLPFIVIMIMSSVLYQYQRTIGLQGYKHYLERRINALVGQNIMSYGHIGVKYMLKKNWVALLNVLLYAIIYILACVIAYVKVKDMAPIWYILHGGVFLLFVVFTIWQTTGYTGKVTALAEKIFESESSLSSLDKIISEEKKKKNKKKKKKKNVS